jgi:hypothetical protein
MSGRKDDQGKDPVMMGLFRYFPRALAYTGKISAYGVKKYALTYAEKNWEKVEDGIARYGDALGRHLLAEAISDLDPESGLLHQGHAAWCALARLELTLRQKEEAP